MDNQWGVWTWQRLTCSRVFGWRHHRTVHWCMNEAGVCQNHLSRDRHNSHLPPKKIERGKQVPCQESLRNSYKFKFASWFWTLNMYYIKRKQLVHQIRSKQIQSYSYFWYNKLISLACWILCGHGKSVECVSGYYLTLFQTHRDWKACICTSDPFPNQFSSIWHKLLQLLPVFKLLTQLS